MSGHEDHKLQVAAVFDRAAESYDQTGVDFFGRVGRRLVEVVDPQRGERVLDLGAGLGASALPTAVRVGPTGRVLALDLSPRMVEGLAARARDAGLTHLECQVGDAEDPDVDGHWDVVQAGLCLFFLPDLPAAAARYQHLLRPGGRLGFSWFGGEDHRWDALYASLVADLPPQEHGPKRPGGGPFSSTEAMDEFLADRGYVDVQTRLEPTTVVYESDAQWWATLWSHGRRATLERLREAGVLESTMRRMGADLDAIRRPDGTLEWSGAMAFTLARTATS